MCKHAAGLGRAEVGNSWAIQNRRLGNSEQDCRFRIDYKIVDRGVREVPAGARLRAAVRLFCVVCEVKPCKC